jgi:hypothetical protein
LIIYNKTELDEVILKMTQTMNRPKFVEKYMDISDWCDKLTTYPTTEKAVYEFFWVIPC